MSYQYDEQNHKYVLNTSYPSTPASLERPVAPESTKSSREPQIFRIISKSRMTSFEEQKSDLTKQKAVPLLTTVANSNVQTVNKSDVQLVNMMKPQTIKFDHRQDRTMSIRARTSHPAYFQNSSLTDRADQLDNSSTVSKFKEHNPLNESAVDKHTSVNIPRQSINSIASSTPSVKESTSFSHISATEVTRSIVNTDINKEPLNTKQEKSQHIKISEINRLHETKLQQYERQKRHEQQRINASKDTENQQKVLKLQEENSNLRGETRRLTNDLNVTKAKLGSFETNSKQQIEQMRNTNIRLQGQLTQHEQLKKELESKLANRMILPVTEIIKKIDGLLQQVKGFPQKIKAKDVEISKMAIDLRKKDDEVKNLNKTIKGFEDGTQHLKIELDIERKCLTDTCRQLQEQKAQLRKIKDQLSRNNYQGIWDINEVNKRRIHELTRQLDNAKQQVRRAKEQMANHNRQRVHEQSEHDRRRVVELTRECEHLRTKTYELERNLQLAQSKLSRNVSDSNLRQTISNIPSMIMPKEALTSNIHHRPLHVVECPESDYETLKQLKFVENQLEKEKVNSAKLSKMVNDLNSEINILNQHLSKFQTDFNSITYLHTIKEKELSETAKKFETLQLKHKEKISELQTSIATLQCKINTKQNEYKQQFRILNKELEDARSKWYNRILYELSFQDALKELLQEIDSLKRKLTTAQENSIVLKEKLWSCESTINNLNSELQVEKCKGTSDRKTLEVNHQMGLQQVINELAKAQRLSESLSNKVKQLTDQNRGKDTFIVKILMGKQLVESDKLNIQEFFKQFQEIVPVKDHKKKLEQQRRQIEQLEQSNRLLVKELARMRGAH